MQLMGQKDIEGAKKIEISMGVKQGNFLLKVKTLLIQN
ncbi:hypothetical protein RTO_12520 [[Ruminococcus] torques L2-14]|uniref:Uncharacterized protein n=1 Tax=[Ruminococcus] torques L2-14 TaxID=657313 RepID=D4M3S9_9FIRM|nr:hypothetical protein RTO_12520 [[Ruminococcus] torques L2-14]